MGSTGNYDTDRQRMQVVGMSSSILSVLATVILWVYCAIRCSRELHDKRYVQTEMDRNSLLADDGTLRLPFSFAALMRSPMSFFETVPQVCEGSLLVRGGH
jgi:hypothetical protein